MVAAAHDEEAGTAIDFTRLRLLPGAQNGEDGDG
jgi:hypothetical protein